MPIIQLMDGNYSGTAESVMAWASCKWSIDINIIRAVAKSHTGWHQDCAADLERARIG